MDYNHYVAQTQAKNTYKKGSTEWEFARKEVFDAYMDYFQKEYTGNKSPVHIGHHFSMWNDAVYWEAMKDFAREVCGQENVVCTNYSKLVDHLESQENS